jgi:hypothetical protein
MKLSQVLNLGSDRAVTTVLSRAATSQCSHAWGNYKKLTRALPYANTNANAEKAVNEADAKIKQHSGAFFQIVAQLGAKSFVLDVDQTIDYVTSSTRAKTNDDITKLAAATGLSEAVLRKADIEKRAKAQMQAEQLRAGFKSRFGEMEFSADADDNTDPDISAESVLKAVQSLILQIATWDKPDYAAIMILRADEKNLETIATREAEYTERAGESSRALDEQLLSGDDMKAASEVK